MNATKRAQVPFGLRKKLMAATSMLLVAAIMLVSTSYAWFTLSTAPEITGITTSVGANGNLEIALLTTETAADMSQITSNTGDSMEASGQTKVNANATWGNLIDLSDPSYGLDKITMYPAALNITADGKLSNSAPLSTPAYGADGRVTMLKQNTASAIYNGAGFAVNTAAATNDFGVRAVGVAANISERQLAFNAAKTNATMNASNAASATKSAVAANSTELLLMAAGGSTPDKYTYAQVEAMKGIAVGVQNSLTSIVKAYANAAAATVLSLADGEDSVVTTAASNISSNTDAGTLKTDLASYSALNGMSDLMSKLDELDAAQDSVATAVAAAGTMLANNTAKENFTATTQHDGDDTQTDLNTVKTKIAEPLIGNTSTMVAYNGAGQVVTISEDAIGEIKSVYLTGGQVGTVAAYAGTFLVIKMSFPAATVYAGAKDNTTGYLEAVKTGVAGLSASAGAATANLAEFYGYIIDFAFRTNAAGSNLLLQTEAVNRVYSDSTDATLATMGGGSNATLSYDGGLTQAQGVKLLKAMRVVFFDPTSLDVYGVGMFADEDITSDAVAATGDLTLFTREDAQTTKYDLGKDAYEIAAYTLGETITPVGGAAIEVSLITEGDGWKDGVVPAATLDATGYADLPEKTTVDNGIYTVGQDAYTAVYNIKADYTVTDSGAPAAPSTTNCWNYKASVTEAEYAVLADTSASRTAIETTYTETADGVLTELAQNSPQKVSALVYMDGEGIDNSAVAALGNSGTLDFNFQFASDADLVPMENSALKNQTASAT